MERAAAAIARACQATRDDLPSLRERFLAALRRAFTIDAAFFAAADPGTLLFTFAAADQPLVADGRRFLENELFAAADVNRFAALARARSAVATLDDATRGRRVESARWREILDPLGMGDELRVALRARGTTWGFLCLHRACGRGFSRDEVALVADVAPHAAEAIRRIVVASSARAGRDERRAGVVVVDAGRVLASTDAAAAWLAELGLPLAAGDPLPLALGAVVARVDALERGVAAAPPTATLLARSGSLVEVHAARLGGGRAIAVKLAAAGAASRGDLRLAAHALTPAQRRVAELVLQGLSTLQISAELHIRESTVQDHLKVVFDKVGVASRRELVAALLR